MVLVQEFAFHGVLCMTSNHVPIRILVRQFSSQLPCKLVSEFCIRLDRVLDNFGYGSEDSGNSCNNFPLLQRTPCNDTKQNVCVAVLVIETVPQ